MGNDAVNQWLKNPREGQNGIVVSEATHWHVPSVNENSEKTSLGGAIDQIRHVLLRLIHAFTEATDGTKIFQAKWDIKDVLGRPDCKEGEECNFCYVLPHKQGMPIKLVVPTSLQMGWI